MAWRRRAPSRSARAHPWAFLRGLRRPQRLRLADAGCEHIEL